MDEDLKRYWDKAAAGLTFSHPLNLDWLSALGPDARILDHGCGYGRTLQTLREAGWRNTLGVDFSGEMIARGRALHPRLSLRAIEALPLPEAEDAFDAVLLFALLTCIPGDEDQRALVAELTRVLKPGGLLYISDYPLQTDDRNVARYEAARDRRGVYGVWDREDGGVFRHHERDWLRGLLAGFDILAEAEIETTTLGGSAARAVQLLARLRSGG
jgi:SAM-dependent methyltransferase